MCHSRASDFSRAGGFSLIELMVTITIVAILLAFAFPGFEGSMRTNRIATASNELMASMSLARSEALRSPGGSALCTSVDGTTCGGTWNDGWIVWIEATPASNLVPAAPGGVGDRVVRYTQADKQLALAGATTVTTSNSTTTRIVFDRRGRVVDNASHDIVLQPSECPTGLLLRRVLNIRATGQARMTRESCP